MDGKFDIGLEQRKATLGAEYVEKIWRRLMS